jgi:acetyl/propionyl-CoA carboxylase alpha subunit
MKQIEIEWNGKVQKATVLKHGKKLWVHVGGEVICFENKTSATRKSQATFTFGPVKSPMPGKIMKVNVQVGDIMEAKKTLLVLEAMKMEYSIKVPEKAKVKSVSCKVGEQVKEGQILLEVEKV